MSRPIRLPRPAALPTIAPGTPVWEPDKGDFT